MSLGIPKYMKVFASFASGFLNIGKFFPPSLVFPRKKTFAKEGKKNGKQKDSFLSSFFLVLTHGFRETPHPSYSGRMTVDGYR